MRKSDATKADSLSGTADIPLEAKKELVERIVASPSFSKSGRLTSFLTHVCALDREGRTREINEQQIGKAVFGRSQDYDPSIDGIVRSHASRLRLRLDRYYGHEGSHEAIRLRIPPGAYVPIFESKSPSRHTETPAKTHDPSITPSVEGPRPATPQISRGVSHLRSPRTYAFSLLVLAILLLSSDIFETSGAPLRHLISVIHPTPSDRLWRTLFTPGRETLLVVGDAGANMFENMASRKITTDEYSSDAWSTDPMAQTPPGFSWAAIARRSYTPYFAVQFSSQLAQLTQVDRGQLSVVFARDMKLDTLKNSQLILLGGPNYDPWEQLVAGNQNFHMDFDPVENSVSIFNASPLADEPKIFKWKQTDTRTHIGYSLITLTNNLNHNGKILMLQGATAQGDKAAAEFLFDETQLEPLLSKAISPQGTLNNMEIVLQTSFVAGGAVDTKVVGFRVHPAH